MWRKSSERDITEISHNLEHNLGQGTVMFHLIFHQDAEPPSEELMSHYGRVGVSILHSSFFLRTFGNGNLKSQLVAVIHALSAQIYWIKDLRIYMNGRQDEQF